MRLVIGGYAQGKLRYAIEKYGEPDLVWDLAAKKELPDAEGRVYLNHLHLWILEKLADANFTSGKAIDRLLSWAAQREDCVMICDEIGSGIVPVDPLQRRWREEVGTVCMALANHADSVERVICGLGEKLK